MGVLKYLRQDKEWQQACKACNGFADQLVANLSNRGLSSSEPRTLLEAFVQGFQDKDDQRNEILQFFMTAPQTVPSLLIFLCTTLAQHPAVWQKLRTEVLSRRSVSLSCETVKSMPYMRHVMHESETLSLLSIPCAL